MHMPHGTSTIKGLREQCLSAGSRELLPKALGGDTTWKDRREVAKSISEVPKGRVSRLMK